MKPTHHLDITSLMNHSAGGMPSAFAIVAATHLSLCPHCRLELDHADRIGGVLLDKQEPAMLRAGAREMILDRIKSLSLEQPEIHAQDVCDLDALPLPLRPYFGETYSQLAWRFVAPGIHRATTHEAVAGGDLMLLRVAPGKSIPEHTHGGNEMTCILRGAYDDLLGHFGPGDLADLDGETFHQPVTSPGSPCICVAATDAPLRFKGWFARTLQPLFGL